MTDALELRSDALQSSDDGREASVIDAVLSNSHLLASLIDEVASLREIVATGAGSSATNSNGGPGNDISSGDVQANDECKRLRKRIVSMEKEYRELEHQNSDLAAKVANSSVKQVVSSSPAGGNESLSWEEQKALILQQLENDTFDSEEFHSSMAGKSNGRSEVSPSDFLDRMQTQIESRDQEVLELRGLLEQQSQTREDGVAIGAAAIAGLVDSDELVQQERQRLQMLHEEWEEKLRDSEIEASLERARLSRERKEVANKTAELELQLERVQRELRSTQEPSGQSSRRWLTKLGLSEDPS